LIHSLISKAVPIRSLEQAKNAALPFGQGGVFRELAPWIRDSLALGDRFDGQVQSTMASFRSIDF